MQVQTKFSNFQLVSHWLLADYCLLGVIIVILTFICCFFFLTKSIQGYFFLR